MTQRRIDRLRAVLETLTQTGEPTIEFLAPEIELHLASSIVATTCVIQGPDAIRRFRALKSRGSFENLSFEAERIVYAPGGEVVVLVHASGRSIVIGLEVYNHIASA